MTLAVWVSIGAPLVALAGVLLGLWLGQKRWVSEQSQKEQALYEENLKSTYLELWDVVEDIHLRMRDFSRMKPEDFAGLIADVNNFMIKKGLFIERRDRYLVLEYLFWTNEFLRRIVIKKEGRGMVVISMSMPEMAPTIDELGQLAEKADHLRNELRDRIREIVKAPASEGWNPEERPSDDLKAKMRALAAEVEASYERGAGWRPVPSEQQIRPGSGWNFPTREAGVEPPEIQ